MTTKQKATELIREMQNIGKCGRKLSLSTAKRCALICVNEIIEAINITTGRCRLDQQEVQMDFDYWSKVKQEIEKI